MRSGPTLWQSCAKVTDAVTTLPQRWLNACCPLLDPLFIMLTTGFTWVDFFMADDQFAHLIGCRLNLPEGDVNA